MKTLHVIPSLGLRFGGPTIAAVEMAAALQRSGVGVRILTSTLDEKGTFSFFRSPRLVSAADRASLGANTIDIGWHPTMWPSRLQVSPALMAELWRTLSSYDIVHIHSLFAPICLATALAATTHRIPYVWRLHGTLDPALHRHGRFKKRAFDMLVGRRLLNGAAAIHCTSDMEADWVREAGYSAPVVVIPLGVKTADFANLPRGRFRRAHGLRDDAALVVFLGRITQKKGIDLLLRAFRRIRTEFPDARLILAGPDDEGYGSRVRMLIDELGLGDRVILTGMVLADQKRQLLGDADVWALTSYGENFGISVLEALASGLPVIVTDRIGVAAAIRVAQAGVVVTCEEGAVASGLDALLGQPLLREQLGRNARTLALKEFSWDRCALQLGRLYEELVPRQNLVDRAKC